MALFPTRPIFHETAIRQALEAMRTGRALRAHPLQVSLIVLSRLSAPYAIAGEVALQVAIFDYLREVIIEQLTEVRRVCDLSPPHDSYSDQDIIEDFSQNNLILEAWSFLYYRYVCVMRDLSMQQIEIITGRDQRLLRHRQTRAITLLTEILISREQIARQQEITQRLRLALPVPHPPKLIGVESMVATALHFLIDSDPPRHLVLHGPEGIGKTALAQLIAHRVVEANVIEDMLWVTVPDPVPSPTAFFHGLISTLRLPVTDGDNPVWTLRAYLLTHPTLIVLDRADELLRDESYAADLLTTLSSALIVLTSRITPSPDLWCYLISLPGLNREQAFTFLEAIAYRRSHQDDATRFQTIWSAVGGNPAMLRTVFSFSQTLPVTSAFSSAGITHLYERIWERLPIAAQYVSLIALFFSAEGVTYQEISLLSRLDREQIDQALLVLADQAFLSISLETQRYTLLPAPATFLSGAIHDNLLLEDGESAIVFARRAFRRRIEHLIVAPDSTSALNLLKLASTLLFSETECWEYTFKLAPQITAAGRWLPWHQHLTELLQYEYSPSQLAWIDLMAGTALRWLGQLDAALHHLERARVYYVNEANPRQAEVMGEIAVIYRYRGDWQIADLLLQQALDLYIRLEDTVGVERCLHELAQLSFEQGNYEQALGWLERLEHRTVRSWGIAGQIYASLNRGKQAYEAAQHIQSSLEESLPFDSSNYGRAVATLGMIYDALGESDAAVPYLLQAVDLLERAKDIVGYARACNNLSVAYLKQSPSRRDIPLNEIVNLLTSAQHIQEHIGDRMGLAITLQNSSWLATLEDVD